MTLKIYNSLTNQKEEFKPIEPGRVKMYVCGPTVYDEPHIGHLRSAYVFDVIRRYLEFSGYEVDFVRNVTDVDDKIIEKAKQNNPENLQSEVQSVSEKYLQAYKKDLVALEIREPSKEPRATAHITEMIRLIEKLLKSGYAYEKEGDVYFDVNAFGEYGKLSHQKKDEMLENVRIDVNEKKRNPLDFALWKNSKEGEPSWPSPWGSGRPGWHIECSAMSMKYLGETFDIHGGGLDLKFPHHENEIAQSQAATGKPFARCWVHHGLLTINEQKMSKSLGNFIALQDIKANEGWSADDLKFLFLGTHYRSVLGFSFGNISADRIESMKMAHSVRKRFIYFFDEARALERKNYKADENYVKNFEQLFRDSMDDDFNIPEALSVMHAMMRDSRKSNAPEKIISAANSIRKIGNQVFGIFLKLDEDPERKSFQKLVDEAIAKRSEAKKKEDFKTADEIRDKLLRESGIELIDLVGGETIGRRKI